MKFTKMRLHGSVSVDLPIIGATPSDTFLLKGADGLGPTIRNAIINGGVYQGNAPADREIVMRVGLNPNYGINQTPDELRSTLYQMLEPKPGDRVKVEFLNGGTVVAQSEGYVDNIEIVPFSKDPEVQITFPCMGPYLDSPLDTVVVPTGKALFNIDYAGTAPSGFRMEIEITTRIPFFKLSRVDKPELFMTFGTYLDPGTHLIIDTRAGSMEITMVQGTFRGKGIGTMSVDSTWLNLYSGVNQFACSHTNFNWVNFRYNAQYMGV